jgi:hypothetical protein
MHFSEGSSETLAAIITIGMRPIDEIQVLSWAESLKGINLEVIFVFDNFNDHNLESAISSKFDSYNIKNSLFHVDLNSPGKSREFGMKQVNSEWIVFWDCDDKPVNVNQIVDSCLNALSETNCLVFRYKTVYKSPIKSLESSLDRSLSTWSRNPGIWRVYFRRERISNLTFEDMKMGEDQVFLAKCSLEERETKFIDLVAYEYFVGLDGQLTQNRNHVKEVLRALDSLNKYFVSSNQNKSRYQKQIELNLTKSALKIDYLCTLGSVGRLKYLVRSRLVREFLKLKIAYFLRIGS